MLCCMAAVTSSLDISFLCNFLSRRLISTSFAPLALLIMSWKVSMERSSHMGRWWASSYHLVEGCNLHFYSSLVLSRLLVMRFTLNFSIVYVVWIIFSYFNLVFRILFSIWSCFLCFFVVLVFFVWSFTYYFECHFDVVFCMSSSLAADWSWEIVHHGRRSWSTGAPRDHSQLLQAHIR